MQPLLAMALALGFAQGPAPAVGTPIGVKDSAKMFSTPAVTEAEATIASIRKATGWQAVVETIDTLDGKPIADRASRASRPWTFVAFIS